MLIKAWHHLLKGNFMEGKQNQCLNHLIYILVDQAIPFFIQWHRHQEFGFEGGDLEVEEQLRIKSCAKSIKIEDITAVADEDKVYLVQSQSKKNVQYRVDLEAYDCDCRSFPVICFCKHIYAVQVFFDEAYPPVSTSLLKISCSDSFDPNPTLNLARHTNEQSDFQKELPAKINSLVHKLSSLTISLQPGNHCNTPTGTLECLCQHIDDMYQDFNSNKINLPHTKKIPPNKCLWTETVSVMNVPVKSKRKKHTDPYCCGEQSGKWARTDARHSLGMTDIISTTQPLPLPQSANSIGASTIQLSTLGPGKTSLSQPVLCAATPTLQNQLNATEPLKICPATDKNTCPC